MPTSSSPADRDNSRKLLERRAQLLARPLDEPAHDTIAIVTFSLAGEVYAFESRYVFEAMVLDDLSRLPGAEPPVLGVTNWRGALLHVLDLRPILGLSTTALNDLGHLIVLGGEGPVFGVLADQVNDHVVVPLSALRDPPDGVARRREYIRGVTGDAVVVLSAEKLLVASFLD